MTNTYDLQHLTRWCAARHLLWQPSRTEQGLPAILLRPHARQRPWQDMLLVEDDEGVTLIDNTGDLLASASEIPALLDALDAGLVTHRVPAATAALALPSLSWGFFRDQVEQRGRGNNITLAAD